MTTITHRVGPFPTRDGAWYWAGGVLAEDKRGGWWSLHAATFPGGVDIYSIGLDESGAPRRVDGFPPTLAKRYAFAWPADGGAKCICIVSED